MIQTNKWSLKIKRIYEIVGYCDFNRVIINLLLSRFSAWFFNSTCVFVWFFFLFFRLFVTLCFLMWLWWNSPIQWWWGNSSNNNNKKCQIHFRASLSFRTPVENVCTTTTTTTEKMKEMKKNHYTFSFSCEFTQRFFLFYSFWRLCLQ